MCGMRAARTFKQHDLVVLHQTHEAGHHLGELDDLLHAVRHLVRDLQPQLRVRLKQEVVALSITAIGSEFGLRPEVSTSLHAREHRTNASTVRWPQYVSDIEQVFSIRT